MSKDEAEFWANYLRSVGYHARIERLEDQVASHAH